LHFVLGPRYESQICATHLRGFCARVFLSSVFMRAFVLGERFYYLYPTLCSLSN